VNPLIPGPADIALATLVVFNAVLVVAAVVSLASLGEDRRRLSMLLLIILVPIAGPVVSLISTRSLRRLRFDAHESNAS
jgi:hypothetical protein